MAVATNSKTQIPADWRQVSLGDVLTLGTVFLCLSPNPPSRVVGALERDVRGKETRLSGRIWGRLGQWLPLVAVGGRGALLMEGPEAAGNARWPIWHELGDV